MRRNPLQEWLAYFHKADIEVYPGVGVIDMRSYNIGRHLDEYSNSFNAPALKGSVLRRAEKLARHIIERGGKGSIHAQDTLIEYIASRQDSASIPFWVGMLDWKRKRESGQYIAKRREQALAALALLALISKNEEAHDALQQAIYHPDSKVRALAIFYLGHAYYDAVQQASGEALIYHERTRYLFDDTHAFRAMPKALIATLHEIATLDDAFAPRFQARELLRLLDEPVPRDHPNGTYAFKVKFWWHKRTFRVIEMRSIHTLEDLFFAIQASIEWDTDHLYLFSLNGTDEDRRYQFVSPWESDYPVTPSAVIGEMGFAKKHKFLYLFDYGDSHRFEVEVVSIKPQADNGIYPRVIQSKGEAPAQYYVPDDGEEWD